MDLPLRQLGTSDLRITSLGFGSWAVGGSNWAYGWGPQDDHDSIATIHAAVDAGINWIDTAQVYGLGHSEKVVGDAVALLPAADRPYLFTKGGEHGDPERPSEPTVQDSRPSTLRRELEGSLRRLRVEQVDLYQIHWPDPNGVPIEDSWAEMVRFLEEGKTRAIGVCNYGVDVLRRAEAIRHVESLQPPFSLIRRDTASELLPWAKANGTGVIVYSPMQSGLLTDAMSVERLAALPASDWRRRGQQLQEPLLSRNLALRDALRPVARRHGTSVAAVAIAWVLAWPGVTGAIVGARRPDQIGGWIDGAAVRLTDADLDEIGGAIEAAGAGSGPARPPRDG